MESLERSLIAILGSWAIGFAHGIADSTESGKTYLDPYDNYLIGGTMIASSLYVCNSNPDIQDKVDLLENAIGASLYSAGAQTLGYGIGRGLGMIYEVLT